VAPSVVPSVTPRVPSPAPAQPVSTPLQPSEEIKEEEKENAFTPSPTFSVPTFTPEEKEPTPQMPSPSSREGEIPANPGSIAPAAPSHSDHIAMENVLDVEEVKAPEKAKEEAPIPPTQPVFAQPSFVPPSPAPAPSVPAPQNGVESEPEPEASQPKAMPRPDYKFPSIELLKNYQNQGNIAEKQAECDHRCQLINQAMTDLHAGAHVVSYCIGPSVTRYDIQTDPDVSVSSLGKYVKDISVRLGGVSTRYEEVVRGKSTSGLEIANSTTTTVSLKEMVNSLPKGDKYNLVIPFGKSISGEYIFSDLSEFPHMLVAGTTGSGKSIFMHGVIMSLIMRNRPEDLKLVVVDPKRVEMGKYKDLPHLLCPIIKEPSQAKVCFQKLISEMERRYTLFELSSVSNIRQFNTEYAPEAGVEKLPFIVVVIDEYADLVDTCKDIGESVVRLAQKARAAGIHLVLATQRPSVSVITGVIKANLPCRVALSMNSATDSLTILGEGGAEDLVGHGDMLVDCSQVARNGFTRCQGCMVDNNEIKAVTDFIRSEAVVQYDPAFLDLVDHEAQEKAEAAAAPVISKSELKAAQGDDLYNTIKADIMTKEYTSISKIQREYGVGFPRAGKIFARLQSEGIVAAAPETASSAKGCKVLVHEAQASNNAGSTDQSNVSIAPNGGGSR
jgi:S-DNA-T family DNA segregation ATPase FtsK/SpoIIIE